MLHLHGLGAALSLINSIGVDRISGHVLDLGDCLIAHMDRLGIGIVGPRARVQRSHIYVLNLPGQIWLDYLASKAVRVSRQQGGIRVSFAMFNTVDEINQLAEIIYEGARNSFLRQEVLRIRSRTGVYRRHAFGALGRIKSSYDQHEKIINAVEKRDAEAASLCMADHMRPGRDSKTLNDFIMSLPRELPAG